MIPVFLWWVLGAIVALIVGTAFFNFVKEKHTWIVMGDAASGKTEFLCMLQDMQRDPKGKEELSHATFSTPASETKTVEVLNQTIVFCDGPGALKSKRSRLNYTLNGPVKKAIESDQGLVLLYMIDMENTNSDEARDLACKKLFAEVGMFFKGFAQLLSTGAFTEPRNDAVTEETIKRAGGKVIVVGTHMDKVKAKIAKSKSADSHVTLHEILALKTVLDWGKTSVALSPFLKDVTFKFAFGDLYNYKGRCEFLKELGEVLKED